jgi:hypothetical protein
MFNSFKGFWAQFNKLIARCWIAPLDDLLWESVGLEQSTFYGRLRSFIVWLRDVGRLVYSCFRISVTRWDGSEWSVIYISDDVADSEKELQYLLFSETPTSTRVKRAFVWQLAGLTRQFVAQGCLVVCDLNRLINLRLRGMYCFRVCPWLRASLDVSVSPDLILKRTTKYRRKNVSKVKKLNFEYQVGCDPADLEPFYYEMYLPYTTERFRDRAFIPPPDSMRELFENNGQLLCVEYEGQSVTACLGAFRKYGETFSALFLGVHQDGTPAAKQDAIVALYWHIINWAHAQHLRRVDFGRNRARLDDGVFEFKRRWGMRFERDITTYTTWTFIGQELPPALIGKLNELAFVAEVGPEYRCVVFANGQTGISEDELARRTKVAAQAGLDGLLILSHQHLT